MTGLGEFVGDPVLLAEAVEDAAAAGDRLDLGVAATVLGRVGGGHAVVGQHRANRVGERGHDLARREGRTVQLRIGLEKATWVSFEAWSMARNTRSLPSARRSPHTSMWAWPIPVSAKRLRSEALSSPGGRREMPCRRRQRCVLPIDEKGQIQALDRTQPGLAMKGGQPATATHDYVRRGATTLFAALDVLDGTVAGRRTQRHRRQEFVRFPDAVEAAVPTGKLIHATLDDHAARGERPKAPARLARRPRWAFRSTPTSCSRPSAVEGFLATLARRRPRRGASARSRASRPPPTAAWPGGERRSRALRLDRRARGRHRDGAARVPSVPVGPSDA
jgi:hypothetical protein